MNDSIKRNSYRIARNFTALVVLLITVDFLIGPIYYVVGISRHGWYSLAPWQIKMMFTTPLQDTLHFSFIAAFLVVLWELPRFMFLAGAKVFQKVKYE